MKQLLIPILLLTASCNVMTPEQRIEREVSQARTLCQAAGVKEAEMSGCILSFVEADRQRATSQMNSIITSNPNIHIQQ